MVQKGKPSALHHYTSMGTLVALLNGINENDQYPYFTFHATNAYQMNDKIEGVILLDKFFSDSKIKNEHKQQYIQMERKEGEVYIISFCRSDNKSKNVGSIPMWNMYGDRGNGAILVFDYEKLQEYISQQGMSLVDCLYINSKNLKEITKATNNMIRDTINLEDYLSNLRLYAFQLKDWHWGYENEWRILARSQNNKLKVNNNKAISYTEIQIPTNSLKSIIIGPLVEFAPVKMILDKKINELQKLDNSIKINVKHSTLQIR